MLEISDLEIVHYSFSLNTLHFPFLITFFIFTTKIYETRRNDELIEGNKSVYENIP